MSTNKRRKFDKEYKLMVVNLCLSGKAPKEVAKELGINSSMVHRWIRENEQYGDNSFKGNGVAVRTEADEKIARLERELKEAQLECEILKKAVSIFSKSDSKSTRL